jgi:hypothetical protein
MKNKSLIFLVIVFFLGLAMSSFAGVGRADGASLKKAKVPRTINGVPVNQWQPTDQGFYSITDHAIAHFSFKSVLPEKEAKILDGMKIFEWYVGYFIFHPDTPEAKVDQFLCFNLGNKEPEMLACFDYRSLGKDREGVRNGPVLAIYYELYELKFFMPVAPSADKIRRI